MPEVQHDSFTLERRYAATPARVYRALTDPRAKAAWFVNPHGWEELERHMDARVGGTERVVGRNASGTVSAFDAVYMDLLPNERIIFAYKMHIDEKPISCSLATWELHAEGAETRLVLTEHGTFLNGYVDGGSRLEGSTLLLNALGNELATPELVCTRLLPFPRERAFAALSDVDQLVHWWGPDGFTSTSEAFDFRPGGSWTMVMHGPDGTDYPNLYHFHEIDAPARVVMEHPDPAHWFKLTVGLDEVPGGTLLTWCQRFNSEEHLAQVKDFVTAANEQVLARLEAVLAR
jgi:uncharacterized protein YndB with AHSA1/START domain